MAQKIIEASEEIELVHLFRKVAVDSRVQKEVVENQGGFLPRPWLIRNQLFHHPL